MGGSGGVVMEQHGTRGNPPIPGPHCQISAVKKGGARKDGSKVQGPVDSANEGVGNRFVSHWLEQVKTSHV